MTQRTITAAVLVIGNEILSGRTKDVNLNHLAVTLGGWGIAVREARVVPDIESEVVAAINALRARYQYVFTTGGIGPTHDDITAACVAAAFGVPVVQHPEIAERINAISARFTRAAGTMRSQLLMARVPEGAGLIENPTGGPQGFFMENVYVMAGIPRVMQAMLSSLESELEHGAVVGSVSVSAYLGESRVAEALADIQDAHPDIDIGSYPFSRDSRYGTSLVARGTDPKRLQQVLEQLEALIREAGETPFDQIS
ncbi:MAG: competence/damage-inducible protein A [Pseudomonadales bacterium]